MNRIDVAIAIISDKGKVLICRRRAGDRFGGCWEFPGGKREPGETIEQCLVRELREELAIEVTPTGTLARIEHDYPSSRIRLHPYLCTRVQGDPVPLACAETRWVDPLDLRNYSFPPANEQLIEETIAHLTGPDPNSTRAASGY
jgi:mutator protein MutT